VTRLLLRLAAASLLLAGCTSDAPDPGPLRSVALRLGPESFVPPAAPRAVAQIGDEARAVVVAPSVVLAAEARAVPVVDGKARVTVTLAPEAVTLPDAALVLSYQGIPVAVANLPQAVDGMAAARAFKTADSGFRIERQAGDATQVAIELAPGDLVDGKVLNLRLHGILPIASRLESSEFTVPEGALLELGYGLAQNAGPTAQPRVRFVAVASCAGKDEPLVDATVGGETTSGTHGWQDASRPLPAGARCRLRLEATSLTDDDVRGAVWAVPRLTAPVAAPKPRIRSVVVISLDTLRADHLSGYGYERDTSPRIDEELIARGTTFRDASTTFPRTDVAHLSLFSSLYPSAQAPLGRVEPGSRVRLLAEALRDAGFETAAFTEDALVAGSFGFWFGFDRFVERSFVEHDRGVKTFADGARFLESRREERSFLFLHTYKTHDPYVSNARYGTLFTDGDDGFYGRIPPKHRAEVDAYDRTIREADDLVGDFLASLEKSGLAASTLVVLLSDHGEAFGEHNVARHGTAYHQEQLHVPLVFRGPGIPDDQTIDEPVSLVDVAPTILGLLGLPPLPAAMGIDLSGAIAGAKLDPKRPLFFDWLTGEDRVGMRLGSVKLIQAGSQYTLLDLEQDPDEATPRRPTPEELTALAIPLVQHRDAAAAVRAATAAPSTGVQPATIPSRVEESLRALGYL